MPRKKKKDSSFGPRLAALRKARGLTQVQFAKATETTQRSISYYENDDGVPRPETRRLWKWFQMVTHLPEKDRRAVIRLINSLAAVGLRRNGSREDHDGR